MALRAIKYMRWSSDKQSKGSSFARQNKKIDELCERMGWEIVETHVDEGVSAYSGANMLEGHLAKLRERFVREGGDGWVLCVEQLDRLSRLDTITVIEFFIAMTRTGLTIAIGNGMMVVDAASLRNQTAQLEEIVRESHRANREGDVKSERSRGAWDEMRELGIKVHTSGTCPAWLTLNKERTKFTVVEERAEIVRQIFRDYAAGMGKRQIAKKLNDAGVKPFRGAKLGWQHSAIGALIANRGVIGEYQHQSRATGEKIGDPISDYFPQIVDNELWQLAHDTRSERFMSVKGREVQHRNILEGVAVCAHCGSRMSMNRKTQSKKATYTYTYLRCSQAELNAAGCHNRRMRPLERYETGILDHLLGLALDDQVWSDETKVPVLAAKVADLRRDLDDLNTRLANVVSEIERRPSDRLSARLVELEAEEAKLLGIISEAEQELNLARGAVSPAEHLKRVNDIRADMARDDEAGTKARKTIKIAINDIVDRVEFRDDGFVFVSVKHSFASLRIYPDGRVAKLDMRHPARDYPEVVDPAMRAYLDRDSREKAKANPVTA